MRKILTLTALFLSLQIYAQKKLQFVEPYDVIEEAAQSFQNNDTTKAFLLLNTINENDSLYMTAIAVKAEMILGEGNYKELIDLINSFETNESNNYKLQIYKGLAFLRSEQTINAINHYKEMLQQYPKSYLVYYNLAVSYQINEQYEKAISAFKQSILFNPYYAASHLELAELCYHEDLISQAILCYNTYLLLNPTGPNSLEVLQKLDEIVSTKNENEMRGIEISVDDNSFQEIDLLIKNYTALNKAYKTPNKIGLPLVKQNHALMELLNQYEGNGGFWEQKYVKFYKELFNSGYFNDFIYYIISSTTNEKYKKILRKNAKNEEEFIGWVAETWMSIIGDNNTFENKKGITYSYFNNGEIQSLGKEDKNGNFIGACYFYTKFGNLRTKGSSTNQLREGKWVWYYENGQKEEEANYKNGKLNGEYIKYTLDGKIIFKTTYADNLYNGDLFKYNQFGVITEHSTYVQDSLNGTTILYHNLGKQFKRLTIPYEKNIVNGLAEGFYEGGEKKFILDFEDGVKVREEKTFFTNGNLLRSYLYEDGVINGLHKEYYADGGLYEEGHFKNDNKNGEWKKYYKSGQLYSITNYTEKGILSELYEEYDRKGNKTLIYEYKNGDIVSYSFFNKKGELLSNGKLDNNKIFLNGIHSNGSKMVNGLFKKGKRDGSWQYFNNYGGLTSTEEYSMGKILEDKDYFLNGNIKSITLYNENSELDGYYKRSYIDGSTKSEGYYKNDNAEKEWIFYYEDGTVSIKNYYFHNDLSGYQYEYSVNGKLFSKNFYKDGFRISSSYYDTEGVELDVINYYTDTTGFLKYKNGSKRLSYSYLNGYAHGEFIWYHYNGKIFSRGNYFNGERHGYWTWYNDKGIKTSEGNYDYGNKTGLWKNYYNNGKIKSRKNFVHGELQGESSSYSEEGHIDFDANYDEDELNGEIKYYSPSGKLQLIRYYDYGTLLGYSYFDKNKEVVPMIEIKDGTAEIKSYYPSGNIAREINFVNGDFDGFYKKYFDNGNLAEIDKYEAGINVGESMEYYENGQIKIQRNYLNGALHGDYKEYYLNGQIKEELHFLNDSYSGLCTYYNEDGSVSKKIFYFNGIAYDAEYFNN